jgi:hypothetical protein
MGETKLMIKTLIAVGGSQLSQKLNKQCENML